MRVTVLCPSYPPMPGGVSDFTRRFAQGLTAEGDTVTVIASPGAEPDPPVTVLSPPAGWGLAGMPALEARLAETADVVVVQYVPHLYERRGMPLGLPMLVWRLGRAGMPVVTIAHELYYARHEGFKVQLPGAWERLMLLPLFAGSRRIALTVPDRLARMRRLFPSWSARFSLMPIGNNLSPSPGLDRRAWRERIGLPEGALALLFMGLAHPSKELATLAATLDRLQAAGIPARLLVAGGAHLDHPHALNLGYLSPEAAADALAGADLALLPLADGASTRRTSLMNALAAGLPMVSTVGANTDPAAWPAEAIALVPAGDPPAFAEAVLALARDASGRAALGRAGRALFEREYAWSVQMPRWAALLRQAGRLEVDRG